MSKNRITETIRTEMRQVAESIRKTLPAKKRYGVSTKIDEAILRDARRRRLLP